MSLKAFHFIFITASVLLALGCAVLAFKHYWSADGRTTDLLAGLGSLLACAALLVYERYFLKKLKNVDFL